MRWTLLTCLLFLLLCEVISNHALENQGNVGCNKSVADIVFVLDESGSVGSQNYQIIKNFVINIVKHFDIGPDKVRIGLITFANKATLRFHLNQYKTSESIVNAIKNLPYFRGVTYTDAALKLLRSSGFVKSHGDRDDAPNIAILITDGHSNNPQATKTAANILKNDGVTIFSIGIGNAVASGELNAMASAPTSEHVFTVNNFKALKNIQSTLSTKTCKIAKVHIPTNHCNVSMADILFILDSSGSVSNFNFQIMLNFVAEIVEGFNIGNETVRVGVNIFASQTIEEINLNEYYDKAVLKRAISNIKRITGTTNTADALSKARTISLLPKHGDRPNVPNIVIVITDGNSNNKAQTAQQADQLQKTGAVIFSIGIGSAVNVNELKAIATGPDVAHVFQVKNFKGLDSIKKELATKTCEAEKYTLPPVTFPSSPTPTNCNVSMADILFILDSSGSVSNPNFQIMLNFVAEIVEGFDISNETVRVAVNIFASQTIEEINLNEYYDKTVLKRAISNIKRITGTTNTADALLKARTISLLPKHGDRPKVPNIVIVITDGNSNNKAQTAQQADQLQKTGAVIFSIGIGSAVNVNELKAIATGPDVAHVFQVKNFKGLDSIKKELATKTCEAEKYTLPPVTSPPPPNCNVSMADILFILDSSGSVSTPNFQIMLNFVSEIVEGFDIGNETVRVAVNIFASQTIEEINLNEYYDKAVLKRAISNIKRITGTTNTADALLKARTISLLPKHGDRPNVPNIVIVITDGNSNNKAQTAQQADQLQKTGAVIFSIGIGSAINVNELKAIATGPDVAHVFQVKNFKGLDSIKKELATKTCEAEKYTLPPVISPTPTTTCNKTIADIIFALDTSASVSMSHFHTMLNFVEQIIHTFDIGQDNVRVGVVTFSGRSVLQFHLNKYSNLNQLLDAISKVKYLAGSTNTADALRYIRTTSFLKQNGDRKDVPNIVIVITDGKSNVPVSTSAEAARLKMIATVFSIGIGTHVGYTELKAIATDKKHVFTVNNFEALGEIKHSLAIKTCEVGKESKDSIKCPAKADIVFILDSSGSIGSKNFKKIIKFVQSISKHFHVKPDEVQIGVDTFNDISRTEFNMSKYKNLKNLLDAMNNIPVYFGRTYMGKALKRLREQSMTAAAGARPNVTHIGILITDGRPNGPLNVVAEAEMVKKAGIKLFALGIGPGVNYKQLEVIANQPASKFVFKAENFDSLKSIEPHLSQESCKVAPKKEEIVCTLAADIVFVLDASASVGKTNFNVMLSFVNSLVSKFKIGPQAMQVGMLCYNSRNYLQFGLNKFRNKTELQEAISKVHYIPGNTATGAAISFMHYHMFARTSGYRIGVPKIAIIITDGKSNSAIKTSQEAMAAQKDNIIMFAIGIGSRVNNIELESIASQPSKTHMFSIKNFMALETIVNSLANKTCKEIPKDSKPLTCHDKIPRCHEFKPDVCKDYPRWSHDFCPHYCGMCFTSSRCIDVAPTCHLLQQKNCVEFPAWSRENCAKSCGFCGNEGNKTEIGDKVYSCSYKGKKYQTGESWQDGCEYECSCLDGQRGMFSCWNRCPVYYNLPPQCKLLNIGNNCCKEPVCNFHGKTVRTTGHQKGKQFGVDVCIYDGHKYYQGQSWSVGCEAECICQDAKSGFWICTSRCPHYDNIPSNCRLITKTGQCCKEVKCEFTIDFGRFKGHGKVVDRVNPVTSPPCFDRRPCEELSPSICNAKDLEFWVVDHCPRFCNKCPTPSVPSEGACLVDGKVYKIGETWKQSCSLTCVCEDGHHGIARCFNTCPTFSNLPSSCRKLRSHGKCCERIICDDGTLIDSQKLNNTIGGSANNSQSVSSIQRGCMYKGSYYEPNQMWNDGCEWRCQCVNGTEGLYKCSHRCPVFKNLPPFCHTETVPGESCCQIPVCNTNVSIVLVPSHGKEIMGIGKVTDPVKEGCVYKNTTYHEGENWIDGCTYFCKCVNGKRGMYSCHERCERIRYVPDSCHVVNDPNDDCCEKLACNAVSARPNIQTTPPTIGNCYYKGQMYKQGESWYDECSLHCSCEDAQIGYYHCTDRCFSFSSIPADCTSKPDPNDPKCCNVFDCKKKDQIYGLIGIKNGFGKSLQPNNKYKNKCVYKQGIYQQGETWEDGCEQGCECLDAQQGNYRCHTRCKRYYSLPTNCQLVGPEGNNCCPSLNCSKKQEECKDENEMCESLGLAVCKDDYKDFGMAFCHKTCGLCTPPKKTPTMVKPTTPGLPDDCKDLDDGCADFEMDVCSEAMFSMAVVYCRHFCRYCDREIPSQI